MIDLSSHGPLPRALYRYVWQTSRRHQVRLVVLTAAVFPLSMVPLELQRRIVDDAVQGGDRELLLTLCAVYLAVLFLHGGLKLALRVYRGVVSEAVVRGLRRRAYHEHAGADAGAESKDSGAGTSVVITEIEPVGAFVGESVSEPLLHAGVLVSVFGYMLWIEPMIAMVGMVFCLPQLYFVPRFQVAINRRAKQRIEILRGLGDDVGQQVDAASERDAMSCIDTIYRLRFQAVLLKFTLKFLNNFLHHLGPLSAFLIGGWLVLEGRTELGTVVAFVSGFERVSDPWRELIAFYRNASNARVQYRLVTGALQG